MYEFMLLTPTAKTFKAVKLLNPSCSFTGYWQSLTSCAIVWVYNKVISLKEPCVNSTYSGLAAVFSCSSLALPMALTALRRS